MRIVREAHKETRDNIIERKQLTKSHLRHLLDSPLVQRIAELGTEVEAQQVPRACGVKHVGNFVEIASVSHLNERRVVAPM